MTELETLAAVLMTENEALRQRVAELESSRNQHRENWELSEKIIDEQRVRLEAAERQLAEAKKNFP
jgi:hypothetical protein